MATDPAPRRYPGLRQIIAIVAVFAFILAAFAFDGDFTKWNASVIMCVGLACFAACSAVWW